MGMTLEAGLNEAPPVWLVPMLFVASVSCVLLLQLGFPPTRADMVLSRLPALNAGLNLAATVSLLVGFIFARRRAYAALPWFAHSSAEAATRTHAPGHQAG